MDKINISGKSPNKGDVLWAVRLPMHCGIYENDNTIIHFAPLNDSNTKKSAVIHSSTLEEFSNGSPYIIIEFPSEKCLSPDDVIKRASSRLGENTYNLFFNNCDHFATWCKIGEHQSIQIDILKQIIIETCAFIDESNGKQTKCEKWAEIFCKIYEMAEVMFALKNNKTL